MKTNIPTATVSRLVTYLRILTDLEEGEVKRTSSDLLAEEAQVSAFQVRKDLAYFGRFGTRGEVLIHPGYLEWFRAASFVPRGALAAALQSLAACGELSGAARAGQQRDGAGRHDAHRGAAGPGAGALRVQPAGRRRRPAAAFDRRIART